MKELSNKKNKIIIIRLHFSFDLLVYYFFIFYYFTIYYFITLILFIYLYIFNPKNKNKIVK